MSNKSHVVFELNIIISNTKILPISRKRQVVKFIFFIFFKENTNHISLFHQFPIFVVWQSRIICNVSFMNITSLFILIKKFYSFNCFTKTVFLTCFFFCSTKLNFLFIDLNLIIFTTNISYFI